MQLPAPQIKSVTVDQAQSGTEAVLIYDTVFRSWPIADAQNAPEQRNQVFAHGGAINTGYVDGHVSVTQGDEYIAGMTAIGGATNPSVAEWFQPWLNDGWGYN